MSCMNFNAEGFVCKDADICFTRDGKRITSFSIAVNYGKDDKRTAHFFDCIVWDYDGEITKGMLLKFDGYCKMERWQDNTGKNRSKTVFVAKNIEKIEKKGVESMGAPVVGEAPDFNSSAIPF